MQENYLMVVLSDNGVGMDPDKSALGMGMLNVHTRLTAIGGKVNLDSKPGETSVTVKLPL